MILHSRYVDTPILQTEGLKKPNYAEQGEEESKGRRRRKLCKRAAGKTRTWSLHQLSFVL